MSVFSVLVLNMVCLLTWLFMCLLVCVMLKLNIFGMLLWVIMMLLGLKFECIMLVLCVCLRVYVMFLISGCVLVSGMLL